MYFHAQLFEWENDVGLEKEYEYPEIIMHTVELIMSIRNVSNILISDLLFSTELDIILDVIRNVHGFNGN